MIYALELLGNPLLGPEKSPTKEVNVRDRLNSLNLLLHFCLQSFLTFAREQVQPTHNLQLLRFWPLCCLFG